MPLPPEVRFDRSITEKDRAWLRAMEQAIAAKPKAVIAMEAYCALVDASDTITQRNFRLRRQRQRLMKRLRLQSAELRELRRLALATAAAAAILLLTLWVRG